MRRLPALALILALLTLSACAPARPADPAALVWAMAGDAPPAGALYFRDALDPAPDANAPHAMPDSLVAAAYGDGTLPAEWRLLEAYAVYLGQGSVPCEYACLIVARERDAEAVAAMCARRMAAIAHLCGGEAVPLPPRVMGRTVVYAVGAGAGRAMEVARDRG